MLFAVSNIITVSWGVRSLPPPAMHSEGLHDPPTSSSSQNKIPEASPWNLQLLLSVHPTLGRR